MPGVVQGQPLHGLQRNARGCPGRSVAGRHLAGVGEAAAVSLREARDTGGEYISIDDLQARSKVSSAVIDTLREAGSLSSLPESSQTTLF